MNITGNPDYWSLLGLSPGSTSEQIKRAFRREARRWHPDLNANDVQAEERFKLVNEAYAVLSDPRKRKIWEGEIPQSAFNDDKFEFQFPSFEEYLHKVLGISYGEDFSEESTPENEITNDKYEDIDSDYDSEPIESSSNVSSDRVRDWPARSPSQPPPVPVLDDLETLIDLTPEQALYGTDIEIELPDGTLVAVTTPPLSGDGWRLRLAGVAPGGRDHFLQLRVFTDEGLRIDGLRVLYRLELPPHDAVLGCAIDVPTLSGPVTLQVPPRSSSGRLLRLRGRGMELDGATGDQLVEIVVTTPDDLSEAEQALYHRLKELASQIE